MRWPRCVRVAALAAALVVASRAWGPSSSAGVVAATIAAASSGFDPDFACCGGCSSFKRADAYNHKLATGARIFIWDTKLKTSPAETCLLTFPYDVALNEQEGSRRVRSGRLVGTSYPIDHDYDQLCCEQRGECLAQEEDASGKCRCVAKWGFSGDHCEDSIYDVAARNNSKIFPPSINLTDVQRLLPDLRSYLIKFDFSAALASMRDVDSATDPEQNLLSVLTTGTYRQFAWSTCAYFLAGAIFFALLFIVHVVWSFCCFRCGCRKKDPRKNPKIYSKATKIFWGVLMCMFLAFGAAAAAMSFLTVHNHVEPHSDLIAERLATSLPTAIARFHASFLHPLDHLLTDGHPESGLTLSALQEKALTDMAPHTFLDEQSVTTDVIGAPVFALLDQLKNYSAMYPTVVSDDIDCLKMNITPSVVSRMRIGTATGCFRCKTCSLLSDMLVTAKDRWRRNAYKVQLDLRESRLQLQSFGAEKDALSSAIITFHDSIQANRDSFIHQTLHLAKAYARLAGEARQIAVLGLFALMGLCGLALWLGGTALGVGIATNKRPLARTTCFVAELACLLGLVLTGVLYSLAMMAHDGVVTLQMLNTDTAPFVLPETTAQHVAQVLFDHNLVDYAGMNETLAFADTLRVPPHPTPYEDDPLRVDVAELYTFPALIELSTLARDHETARRSFFGWEQTYLDAQVALLHEWAFGNDSVISPYNLTLHQELLNSSATVLMDPDDDSVLVSDDDLLYIQSQFNETWRGVDDRGVAQNELIASQWLFVAQIERQKQRLGEYLTAIADAVDSTHPILLELVANTSRLESAEFALKAPVEFFTNAIRASKIHDCAYDANCGWFRDIVNDLFANLQAVIKHAEFAAICCAVSTIASLLGLLFAGCFASRLRRNVVKVYSAN